MLHSCSALEGSINHDSHLPAGSDLLVEEESDIYAARLAVCELSSADFSVPIDCRSFVPTSGGKKATVFRGWLSSTGASKPRVANEYYDEVTEANLKQCRKALGSSGQAWTSYSNSRQNAVVMCHAMQSAVERDESRHTAKMLANTAAAATESLQDAFEQVNEFKQQFHELRTAMPKFQQDLATFDSDIRRIVQDFWAELDRARSGLESLATSIEWNKDGMQEANSQLVEVLRSHIPELTAAVAKASQEMADTADTAAASTELVAFTKQRIEQDLIARLDTAGHDLAVINQAMPLLSQIVDGAINNTLQFYNASIARQLELSTAQIETMDNIDRMNQKTEHANSLMDSMISKLGGLIAVMDEVANWLTRFPLSRDTVFAAAVFATCSIICTCVNFVFWHERLRVLSTIVVTAACTSSKSIKPRPRCSITDFY